MNPAIIIGRPEALKTRGELRLLKGEVGPAEEDLRSSISLACIIGSKVSELRATMSLARLLASKNRPAEGRAMLAEIYSCSLRASTPSI